MGSSLQQLLCSTPRVTSSPASTSKGTTVAFSRRPLVMLHAAVLQVSMVLSRRVSKNPYGILQPWQAQACRAAGRANLWMRQLADRLRGVMAVDPAGGAAGVGGGGAIWAAVPARVMQALKDQASLYRAGSCPVA